MKMLYQLGAYLFGTIFLATLVAFLAYAALDKYFAQYALQWYHYAAAAVGVAVIAKISRWA